MAASLIINSYLIRIFDFIAINLVGLLTFFAIQVFKDADLDLQRYASLVFLASLAYLFLTNRAYRSWRGGNLMALFGRVASGVLKTWILILIWLVFSKSTEMYSRLWLGSWAIASLLVLCGSRLFSYLLISRYRSKGTNLRHIAIVGSGNSADEIVNRINQSPWSGYRIQRHLKDLNKEGLNELSKQPLNEIWLALPMGDGAQMRMVMEQLQTSTASIRFVPDWFSFRLINHGVSEVLGVQMIDLYGTPMTGMNLFLKSMEDFFLSILILILISPLMLLLAIGVKLNSPGPVFYRQERVGWNGEVFEIYKFRTMPVDLERGEIVWGGSADKSVTKFSKWLRSTSLDELPQFINVLQGKMSIVGPRPERPLFVEQFKNKIPGYMKKHLVKAGITGWAQIHGWRGDTDLNARIEHDLYYIENWSIWLDLKIIFLTIFRGFVNKNAY
ncbi:undecaprenyl-phosphate glucose phosphotransferase [Polynucleobacter sp. MWH-Aus1W21]|uniref:undecaprenyl-phosphate glucose phosphotransferase n=1 Tax=Polynucleobacter sp. MWH-Aus1W21 TaxID=1855880 RepID=UPI001BFDB81E|nr:undecaprenyl-phosphate glucose phosphotransferase [Polynucleobacter sp. MWH-Aus1W21]QWD66492.1 undecaprenyl-phosphate glucose phosphotransferase [Polynucleobacter sp. MWH-Aus1W21]